MIWSQVLHILFSFISPSPPAHSLSLPAKVSVEEVLSYECAESVSSLVPASHQIGPMFSRGPLVFTSVTADDGSSMLLANAGSGNYEIPLKGSGLNRIRFRIPTEDSLTPRLFFLSYLHGGTMRNRVFEYSMNHPPPGFNDLDFEYVEATRAEDLEVHLDYAIHETTQNLLSAVTKGRLSRDELHLHRVTNCEHIAREEPLIARSLSRNLDVLQMVLVGPEISSASSRMPASTEFQALKYTPMSKKD